MIRYVSGNILKDDAQVLVNPVNCVGAMGKGLALAFKNAYPEIDRPYREACRTGALRPGIVQLVAIDLGRRFVCNFPTKDHWRNPSQLAWIRSGLAMLTGELELPGFTTVALPALGCGLGGLPWDQVKTEIEHAFRSHPTIEARVYAPG